MLGEELQNLSSTGGKSAERLRAIENTFNRRPDLFEGDSERAQKFKETVAEKTAELKSGPRMMDEKKKFWEKWKVGSMVAAGAGTMVGVGSAAFAAKYGFDHTYLADVLGQSTNVAAVAGFASAALGIGSAGVGKLMETIRGDKAAALRRNLMNYRI